MVYIKCQTLFWNLECKSTILPVAHSDIMSLLLGLTDRLAAVATVVIAAVATR